MIAVRIRCVGLSPLLMRNDQGYSVNDSQVNTRVKAAGKLYTSGDIIGIPFELLANSLRIAAKSFGMRIGLFTIKVKDDFIPLEYEGDWKVFYKKLTHKGKYRSSPGCNIFPCFQKWAFCTELHFNEKEVNEEKVRAIIEKAGFSVGLGALSIRSGYAYGRFKLAKWELKKRKS